MGRAARRGSSRSVSFMSQEVYESLVQAALLFAAIFVLSAVVLTVARKMRVRAQRGALDANEIMSNFRDVYERGGLSDEEFRSIKAKLAIEIKNEANDNASAG
jgi:hypothetical protein